MIIDINPVAIELGFFKIHWYGIMYLVGFALAYFLGVYRSKLVAGWNQDQVSDLIYYCAIGVIIGGRLGYSIFYGFDKLFSDPLSIFKIWEGGMSFHGGFIGVATASYIFARKYNKKILDIMDFVSPLVPLGLASGRFANFINGELWGKPTDLPWGMVFPNTDKLALVRHPSMLYEMILEGFVLFIIIWIYSSKKRPLGAVSALWIILYGTFRFLIEFIREPDAHLEYLAWGWVTMGQVLSAPMIILGTIFILYAYSNHKKHNLK